MFFYCIHSKLKIILKNSLFTALAKHISVEEWIQFAKENPEYLEVLSGKKIECLNEIARVYCCCLFSECCSFVGSD